MRLDQLVRPLLEDFEVNRSIVGYHGTHEAPGLVLQNRQPKTLDSMGTWLTTNPKVASEMYGPNVGAYIIPKGRYFLAPQHMGPFDAVLNCLPFIEEHVGPDVAKHLRQYPWDAKGRRFLLRMSELEKKLKKEHGPTFNFHSYLRMTDRENFNRWFGLKNSRYEYQKVAISPAYCQAFRQFMSQHYKGVVWQGRNWDSSTEKSTIFVIFHHEDLHPVQNTPAVQNT